MFLVNVFGNVFLFLHKACFACVLVFWYIIILKTLKSKFLVLLVIYWCKLILFPCNVIALLFSGLLPNTLKRTQKTLFWKCHFFSHLKLVLHAIWGLVTENVKNTQKTRIWYCCSLSQLRVLFMTFSILVSCLGVFWVYLSCYQCVLGEFLVFNCGLGCF